MRIRDIDIHNILRFPFFGKLGGYRIVKNEQLRKSTVRL